MKITLVGSTTIPHRSVFSGITDGKWSPDGMEDDASALIEFAGRACYQSWSRPNPDTATNQGYIDHILDVEHFSVVEHGSVSVYIEDVSRAMTHELVRHRHFSFSQLSQRYVQVADHNPVIPPLYQDDSQSIAIIMDTWAVAVSAYDRLVALWMPRLIAQYSNPTTARKRAREAARCVLPNMTPTSIVVTGNHRSWREFIAKRATVHADAEICEAAVKIYGILGNLEPNLYQDMQTTEVDGRTVVVVRGV